MPDRTFCRIVAGRDDCTTGAWIKEEWNRNISCGDLNFHKFYARISNLNISHLSRSASDAAVAAVVVGVEEVEGLKRSESTNIRDQRSDLNGMNDEVVDGVQHVRCVDAIVICSILLFRACSWIPNMHNCGRCVIAVITLKMCEIKSSFRTPAG